MKSKYQNIRYKLKSLVSSAIIPLSISISANAAEKPNVIIISNDDQGYQDLGCFGSPNIIQNMTWVALKIFFHYDN